jgi:hypothetical protein
MFNEDFYLPLYLPLLEDSESVGYRLTVFGSTRALSRQLSYAEPVFVDLLRSPGIDSQPDGPVRQPCSSYRPARLHRLAESFLGIDSWAP